MTGKKPKTNKERPAKDRLATEDIDLWHQVTKSLKPLPGRAAAPPDAETPKPPLIEKSKRPDATRPTLAGSRQLRNSASNRGRPASSLVPGALAGIDRRTADRLKRGKLPVERRLDLHGMTQANAERALTRFLADAQASGLRNVLVITGKGRTGNDSGSGVLRRELPRWLNQPQNRDRVVAITPAQPKDGGSGAFYLRLKRIRER